MIVLFTDFGLHGPYTGQMKSVLHQMAPGISVIDLFADAPVGNPKASAYLLAAYAAWFPMRTVFLCVVDPGDQLAYLTARSAPPFMSGVFDQERATGLSQFDVAADAIEELRVMPHL